MSGAAIRLEDLLSPSDDQLRQTQQQQQRTASEKEKEEEEEVARWTDEFLFPLVVIRTRLAQLASRARGSSTAHAMIRACASRLPSDDNDALFASFIVGEAARNGDERLVLMLVEELGLDPAAMSMSALGGALRERQFAAALLLFYLSVRRTERRQAEAAMLSTGDEDGHHLPDGYCYCRHDPQVYCFVLDCEADIRVPLPPGYENYAEATRDANAANEVMANVEKELLRRVSEEDAARVQAALSSSTGAVFTQENGENIDMRAREGGGQSA